MVAIKFRTRYYYVPYQGYGLKEKCSSGLKRKPITDSRFIDIEAVGAEGIDAIYSAAKCKKKSYSFRAP